MYVNRLAGVLVNCLLIAAPLLFCAADLSAADDVGLPAPNIPHFRLFLKDGRSLVSFGEFAHLDGRVVFSMPISPSVNDPDLHLVDLPADAIDWARTDAYADSARAARYLQTRADADYALLSGDLTQALNDVGQTDDPRERLAIVQRARRTLAAWPSAHHNHKQAEVREMLTTLDEAIAELRVYTGGDRFALSLVSSGAPLAAAPALEPLLPPPTAQEVVEQTFTAARIADVPAARRSLLTVALLTIERHLPELPAAWVTSVRATVSSLLNREVAIDRSYSTLTSEMLNLATGRAQAADVQGVERVIDLVSRRDATLGSARPDALNGILAAVHHQLDAARRLRLERDRFVLRLPELRRYRDAVRPLLSQLAGVGPALEDIKALRGSGPDAIGGILRATANVQAKSGTLTPPAEFQSLHSLLLSAAQMADSAARLRREAALTNNMDRAWNASSAAAGALMLSARAVNELQAAFRQPQLPK